MIPLFALFAPALISQIQHPQPTIRVKAHSWGLSWRTTDATLGVSIIHAGDPIPVSGDYPPNGSEVLPAGLYRVVAHGSFGRAVEVNATVPPPRH